MSENWKVYEHTSPNGKVYIGITSKSPNRRWSNGNAYSNNKYFTNAINKYGWENFKHEILFENLTKEEACQKEIELIAEYKSNNPEFGYNITAGGEGCVGYHHTEETKLKIGKASRQRIMSEETKRKIGDTKIGNTNMLGKHHSVETKQKMSIKASGRKHTEEAKIKMSESRKGVPNPHKGAVFTEEHKEHIRNQLIGRIGIHNEFGNRFVKKEELDNYLQSGYILGTTEHSEEHKENISIALKNHNRTKEHCKHISDSKKGKPLSKEHKQKLSNAHKGRVAWNKGKIKVDGKFVDKEVLNNEE